MKNIFGVSLIAGALLCASAIAQSTPASQSPSTQTAQPVPQSEAQPEQTQQPQPQAAPAARSATSTASQASAPNAAHIAPGSVLPVKLAKTIDAKKAKPGDEVVAMVTMDMKTSSGEVIVPKDTKVVGHVTEAQARNKEQKESQVGIAFDRAVLKGSDVSLPMSIPAVIGTQTNNSNNSNNQDQGASAPAPSGAGSPTSTMSGGRSSSTSSAASPSSANSAPNAAGAEGTPSSSEPTPQKANARPEINGNTQGVIGFSDLKLEAGQTPAQGSVLSSEKNNVKVEGGTFMLLKVNQ